MNEDFKDFQDKINQFKNRDSAKEKDESKEYADRMTGMRAGSEFIAYIISGAFIGWAIGHYFGNMPLWLILMMFTGFGFGVYRAYVAMNK